MFYDELKDTAKALLTEFGQPCEIEQSLAGDYDITTGKVTPRKRRLRGVCLFNRLAYDFSSSSSNLVQQGDVSVLLSLSANLSRDDLLLSTLSVKGERWQIINCQPLKPAGVTVYYKLQARAING